MGSEKRFRLHLRHEHTDESLDVVYRQGSEYLREGVARLNHFLRDYRTGEDAHYDVREFDLLYALMHTLHTALTVSSTCSVATVPRKPTLIRARVPR